LWITGKTVEDQISDLMALFLKRKFVKKTDRKFKKPKPGKKRLIKFPKTLEAHSVSHVPQAPAVKLSNKVLTQWFVAGTGRLE
jgi:hypothetical protein